MTTETPASHLLNSLMKRNAATLTDLDRQIRQARSHLGDLEHQQALERQCRNGLQGALQALRQHEAQPCSPPGGSPPASL